MSTTRKIPLIVTYSDSYGGLLRFHADFEVIPDAISSFEDLLWHLGETYGFTYAGPHPLRKSSFIFYRDAD